MRINATRLLLRKVEPLVDGSITNLQTLANLTDGGCDEAEAASAVIPIVHKTAADLSNVLEAIRANLPPKKEGT